MFSVFQIRWIFDNHRQQMEVTSRNKATIHTMCSFITQLTIPRMKYYNTSDVWNRWLSVVVDYWNTVGVVGCGELATSCSNLCKQSRTKAYNSDNDQISCVFLSSHPPRHRCSAAVSHSPEKSGKTSNVYHQYAVVSGRPLITSPNSSENQYLCFIWNLQWIQRASLTCVWLIVIATVTQKHLCYR